MYNKQIDAKITRFGYIINKESLDQETLEKIKNELVAKPYHFDIYNRFSKDSSFPLYFEDEKYISIPKYYGLEKFGEPKINKLENYNYPTYDMKYTGKLRTKQMIIVKKILDGFNKYRGGLLIAGCGSGKTNMAIYIACKLKLKTLFIVHKTFLKRQVIDRIRSVTNIKEIGIIQRKEINVQHPFIVGMVKSLANKDYDDKYFRDIGMIIVDEVHHMGAKKFSKVYQKMTAKYMLGITAERHRWDGMYKIINMYMGPILHMEEQPPNDMVIVKKYYYRTCNKRRIRIININCSGECKPNHSKMISNLIHIKRRNRFILRIIEELYYQGKNILCLSGRIKQINLFYKLLSANEYIRNNVGKYIGKMSENELLISSTKQIILGSYDMASEGLDIENLNVVILCTPKRTVKQPIGRILRKDFYEEHPIVIDIVDEDNYVFLKQSDGRDKYYLGRSYNIQSFTVTDYPSNNEDHILWNDTENIRKTLLKIPSLNTINKGQILKFSHFINHENLDFLDD